MDILQIKNLNLSFRLESGLFETLYDVSLNLSAGKMMALVGESGCGKSMTAMSIIRLLQKNAHHRKIATHTRVHLLLF